jgi:hypothetical protein
MMEHLIWSQTRALMCTGGARLAHLLERSATYRPGSPGGGADLEQASTGEARY